MGYRLAGEGTNKPSPESHGVVNMTKQKRNQAAKVVRAVNKVAKIVNMTAKVVNMAANKKDWTQTKRIKYGN